MVPCWSDFAWAWGSVSTRSCNYAPHSHRFDYDSRKSLTTKRKSTVSMHSGGKHIPPHDATQSVGAQTASQTCAENAGQMGLKSDETVTQLIHAPRELEEDAKSRCLVPILDLLNHSPRADVATCALDEAGLHYVVRTDVCYSEGDEVLIHYGDWSNGKLLEYYGFALRDNESDACWLTVSLSCISACVSSTV